jgi:hypothetical protein
MIFGAHILLHSAQPEADRAFFRDVLRLASVDVGGGWLIFKLPPAEMAVHPTDGKATQSEHAGHRMMGAVLYLMCDDLEAQVKILAGQGVSCTEVERENWGVRTTVRLPSGGEIGLYQPTHAMALELK